MAKGRGRGWHGDSAGHSAAARKKTPRGGSKRWKKAQAKIDKIKTPKGRVRASQVFTKKGMKTATKFVKLKKNRHRSASERWPSEAKWG